jgi:hypothetical protein
LLILLFGRGMMRTFDQDEHQFVAPAVLLSDRGLIPYRDYPYFHMPHLIFGYGAATAWIPYKLLAARVISVLCGWGTLLLLGRAGWKALEGQSERQRWLLVGGILAAYLSSQLFVYTNGWAWNHDSAVLCALGAYLLLLRGLTTARIAPIALAGVLTGFAIGIRLSFALIVVPMGLAIWLCRSPLTRRGRGLAFAAAVAATSAALLPAWILWLEDPDAFIFGNLSYADLNTRYYARLGIAMTFAQKAAYIPKKMISDPGNAFFFLLGCYALGYALWRQRLWQSRFGNELALLAGLLPALLIGAAGPNPIQQQYCYMLLPFLCLAGIYLVALECSTPLGSRRWRRVVVWGALLPAAIGIPRWYWQIIYLPRVHDWTPVQVHRTGAWIKDHCPPNAWVLTVDPVFPLEAGLQAYQEYAVGRFIFLVADLMTPEERSRFHMISEEELDRVLAERPPDAIFRHTKDPTDPLTQYAKDHHFRKLDYRFSYRAAFTEAEHFELWFRDPPSGSPPSGAGVGGLAGTNINDGDPVSSALDRAMGSDARGEDSEHGSPPYAGHSGGAVGGTSAQARASVGRQRHGIRPGGNPPADRTLGEKR